MTLDEEWEALAVQLEETGEDEELIRDGLRALRRATEQAARAGDEGPREFEIWSEGYSASGERGSATLHGNVRARDFASACAWRFQGRPDFDVGKLTLYGCRLFDNEAEARRSYG